VTVDGLIADVKTRLLAECDDALEARRQVRFGALLAGDPVLRVPAVHEAYSSDAVLTTSWLTGRRFEGLRADVSQG
jgi:predicted unusual protein kinase regulating ubiquinone biosynthesis (AarF/ABC1/UbiB family)